MGQWNSSASEEEEPRGRKGEGATECFVAEEKHNDSSMSTLQVIFVSSNKQETMTGTSSKEFKSDVC